ncbi:MAG: hypothetical protein H2069_03015 [Legionella sp.]|nr:hypothetical protein [Legionella sp.]
MVTKKIIHNLEKFTKELINLIASESPQEQEKLLTVFRAAKFSYTKPSRYLLLSWLHYYTRKREKMFDRTIAAIESFPSPVVRLQEFQKFVSLGNWELTSANTRLLMQLINSVDGYISEEPKYLHRTIIPPLRELLLQSITHSIQLRRASLNDISRQAGLLFNSMS